MTRPAPPASGTRGSGCRLDSADLHEVRMPLKLELVHARAAHTRAHNLVLGLTLEGRRGGGECIPRSFVTGETVEGVFDRLRGLDIEELLASVERTDFATAVRGLEALDLPARLGTQDRPGLAASCLLELAILDALGQHFDVSLTTLPAVLDIPGGTRPAAPGPFPQGWGVGLNDEIEPLARTRAAYLKVKADGDIDRLVRRIERIRHHLGDLIGIRIDANMSWDLPTALAAVEALAPLGIDWYEEPLPARAWQAYRTLRERSGARLMLDESLCSSRDAESAIAEQACDLFNIRISKVGGLIAAVRMAGRAREAGIAYQVGAHVGQMGILWSAGLVLASALGDAVALEGGLTHQIFEHSLIREDYGFDPVRFEEHVPGGSGLGVTLLDEPHLRARAHRSVSYRPSNQPGRALGWTEEETPVAREPVV